MCVRANNICTENKVTSQSTSIKNSRCLTKAEWEILFATLAIMKRFYRDFHQINFVLYKCNNIMRNELYFGQCHSMYCSCILNYEASNSKSNWDTLYFWLKKWISLMVCTKFVCLGTYCKPLKMFFYFLKHHVCEKLQNKLLTNNIQLHLFIHCLCWIIAVSRKNSLFKTSLIAINIVFNGWNTP